MPHFHILTCRISRMILATLIQGVACTTWRVALGGRWRPFLVERAGSTPVNWMLLGGLLCQIGWGRIRVLNCWFGLCLIIFIMSDLCSNKQVAFQRSVALRLSSLFGRMHPFRRPMVVTKAMHGQAVSTTISSYFMEFRVALARDVCRFAPVITRMAGNTAELFKIGSWSDWQYRQRCQGLMSKMRPPVASGHGKIPEFLVHSKVSNFVTLDWLCMLKRPQWCQSHCSRVNPGQALRCSHLLSRGGTSKVRIDGLDLVRFVGRRFFIFFWSTGIFRQGKILTDLDASTEHMRYSCGSVAGLGSCSEGFTAQADVKDWSTYANLGTLSIVCPQEGSRKTETSSNSSPR